MAKATRREATPLRWIFDAVPASGALQGGTAAAYIFEPQLDAFVREVLQNSHDQRSGASPVRVEFALHKLTGRRRDRFLAAIAWDDLRPHLDEAAGGSSRLGERVGDALGRLDDEPLVVLRVSDGGAHGLTGDEDDPDGNFNGLCRNVLYSADDRPGRGGSHGLGKAVLWRFSSLATVLFSSTLDERRKRFRVFGRTDLPHHATEDGQWAGPGWMGSPETTDRGERAISLLGAEVPGFAEDALLDRDPDLGSGTTLVVVGFFEPSVDEPRPLIEVGNDLLESATRWFWPSLSLGTLEVTASVHESGRTTWTDQAQVGVEVLPFEVAISATAPSVRAIEPSQVAERALTFRIPARRAATGRKAEPEQDAQMNLRLVRSSESDEPDPWRSTIALVRGAGMVVKYWKPSRVPIEGGLFHAVLRAGRAHGSAPEDEALEAFLRTAEPPAHNDWVASTDQMQARYPRGAAARLTGLWRQLNQAVVEMVEQEAPDSHPGPAALARLFALGRTGGGSAGPKQFITTPGSAGLSDGVWRLTGAVHRVQGNGPWKVNIAVHLDGETGRGERLPVRDIRALRKGKTTAHVTADGFGELEVPASVGDVSYELETVATSDTALARRTRIRADVRPTTRRRDDT